MDAKFRHNLIRDRILTACTKANSSRYLKQIVCWCYCCYRYCSSIVEIESIQSILRLNVEKYAQLDFFKHCLDPISDVEDNNCPFYSFAMGKLSGKETVGYSFGYGDNDDVTSCIAHSAHVTFDYLSFDDNLPSVEESASFFTFSRTEH